MACTPPQKRYAQAQQSSYAELVAESRALLHEAKAEAIRERESVSALDKTRRDLASALDQASEHRTASRLARQAARDMQYRVEAESRCQAARRQEIRRKRLEDYQNELREIHAERRRREADSERWWTDKLLGVLEEQVDHSCSDMRRVRGEISRTRDMLAREAKDLFGKHRNCPGPASRPPLMPDVALPSTQLLSHRVYPTTDVDVSAAARYQSSIPQHHESAAPVHTHLRTHVNHAAKQVASSPVQPQYQSQQVFNNSPALHSGVAPSSNVAAGGGATGTTTTYTTSHTYPGPPASAASATFPPTTATQYVQTVGPYAVQSNGVLQPATSSTAAAHANHAYPPHIAQQTQVHDEYAPHQPAPAAPTNGGGVFFNGSAGQAPNHLGEPRIVAADNARINAASPAGRFPPPPPRQRTISRGADLRRRSATATRLQPREETADDAAVPLSSGSVTPELLADESVSEQDDTECDADGVFPDSDDEELVRLINTPTRRRRLKQLAATSPRPRRAKSSAKAREKTKSPRRPPSTGRLHLRVMKDPQPSEDDTASELEAQLAERHETLRREREKLVQIDEDVERKNRSHCSHLMRAITHANVEIKGLRADQHRVLAKERARSRKLERQLTKLEHCYRRVQAAKPRHSWVPSGYGTC